MHISRKRHIAATITGLLLGVVYTLFLQWQHLGSPSSPDFGLVLIMQIFFFGLLGVVLANLLAETFYGIGNIKKISIVLLILFLALVGYTHRPGRQTIYYCNGVAVGTSPSCN